MGKTRSQSLVARLARYFPEEHRFLSSEVEQVMKEARSGSKTRLYRRCRSLLQALEEHRALLPYVAQGFPALLPAVLAVVGGDNDGADGVALRLASLLTASGVLTDTLTDAVRRHLTACVALIFAHDPAEAQLVAELLARAVHLSSDGEQLAVQLLGNEEYWWKFDRAFFAAEPCTHPEVLAACLHLLRACFSVTLPGNCAVDTSRLQRLVTLTSVRDSALVRNEVLQLLVVLRLSVVGDVSHRYDANCLSTLVIPVQENRHLESSGDRDDSDRCNSFTCGERTFSETLADDEDTLVTALSAAFDSLQRDQFDAVARLEDLHLIAKLLFPTQTSCGVAAALLVLLPGAVKLVFAAASGVDENLSACACTILASAIDGTPEAVPLSSSSSSPPPPPPPQPTTTHQEGQHKHTYKGFDPLYYQQYLVEEFFLLGGVVLLEDMLTDYSTGVVMAATRLMRSLLCFSDDARNVVVASRCIINLTSALESISQDADLRILLQRADGEALFLPLALDTLALLGRDAMRLVPESVIGSIGTIATEARENAAILTAAIRALVLLAAAHPMVATLVLDYEYMSSVLTPNCKGDDGGGGGGGDDDDDNSDENSNKCGNTLRGLDAIYICGSFDIMAAIVAQQPSCVSFEWIETLLAASRRLQEWQDHVPAYARAFWNFVLETVKASEDGLAYLQEDEEFLELLFNSLLRCCRLSLPKRCMGVAGALRDPGHACSALEVLPLLVRLVKCMSLAQLPRLPTEVCDVLEAVVLLVATGRKGIPPDLMVDVMLSVTDDTRLWCTLDVFTRAASTLLPVLLKRAQLLLSSIKTEVSTAARRAESVAVVVVEEEEEEEEKEEELGSATNTPIEGSDAAHAALFDNTALKEFASTTAVLSGILIRCESRCASRVLASATDLVLEALSLCSDSPLSLSRLASSCLTAILQSLCDLLRVEDDDVKGVARRWLFDRHVLQLLSRLLRSFQGEEGTEEVRGMVYNVVQLLYDMQTASSSPSLLNKAFIDNAFYTFASEHVLLDCNKSSCCCLLFISLVERASFRRQMLASHAEAYRVALILSGATENADAGDVAGDGD